MLNQPKHQLYLTDCVEGVKTLPDDSLDLILSGPPYFDHIRYSDDERNLSTKGYDEFLEELKKLWANIEPKLKKGGIVALWLHDIYCLNQDSQDSVGVGSSDPTHDFFELKPFHSDIIKTFPKELTLRNIVIWDRYLRKTYHNLPEEEQFGTRFQYILLFSKGKTDYEDKMRELYWNPIWYFKTQPTALRSKLIYKLIFWIGKNTIPPRRISLGLKKYFIKDRYVFKDHLTTCPPEVAEMLIKSFSKQGDTVCDPFLGSGTTMQTADKLGRSCVGFEVNKSVKNVILKKIIKQNLEII